MEKKRSKKGGRKRLFQVSKILKKYKLRRYAFPFVKVKNPEDFAVRLRQAFEELGPGFIKFGQLLSIHYILVPEVYRREFEKMQDKVPEFSFEEAKHTVEREFGKSMNEIFSSFDKKPIASASLSQVHKAVLTTGEVVAVKIQRSNVKKQLEKDISLLYYLAGFVRKKIKKQTKIDLYEMIDEFSDFIMKEIDFEQEAKNQKKFLKKERSGFEKIPKIYFHTKKVVVEEFIDGVKINDLVELSKRRIDSDKVIDSLIRTVLNNIFENGLFHGDPHPANIFVMGDGRVAFLDFGVVGRLSQKFRESYLKQYKFLMTGDAKSFVEEHMAVNNLKKFNRWKQRRFVGEIQEIIDSYDSGDISTFSEVLFKITQILLKYKAPDKNKLLVLSRTLLAVNSITEKYGVDDKQFADILTEIVEKKEFDNFVGEVLPEKINEKIKDFTELFSKYKDYFSIDKLKKFIYRISGQEEEFNKKFDDISSSISLLAKGMMIVVLMSIMVFSFNAPSVFGQDTNVIQMALSFIIGVVLLSTFYDRIVRRIKRRELGSVTK